MENFRQKFDSYTTSEAEVSKSVLSIGFVLSFSYMFVCKKLNTNPILNTDFGHLWSEEVMADADVKGKTYLVTGASTGLG